MMPTFENFKKEFPYYMAVDNAVEYYYYEAIIRDMSITKHEWSIHYKHNVKPKEGVVESITYYGFKQESDLLYFKLAAVNYEKSK